MGIASISAIAKTDRYIIDQLDLSKKRRPELEQKRVNVDFPVWMIHQLDREARRLGVHAICHQDVACRTPERSRLILFVCRSRPRRVRA